MTKNCALFLCALLLSGCSKWLNQMDLKTSLDESNGPLKISRVYWAPYAIGTLAQELGLFKQAGIDVQISVFPDTVDARRAYERGAVDAAMLSPFTFLMTKELGIDSVVTLVLDYSEGADGLVARRDIAKLSDLRGKKIGVEVGTIAHFTLIKALDSAGIKEEEVKIFNIRTDDLIPAFKSRKVDAISSWDPYLNRIIKEENGHLLFSTKEHTDIVSDILVVNRKSYEKRRADWIKFHTAWMQAIDAYKRDPKRAVQLMSHFERQTPEALAQNMAGIRLLSRQEQLRFLGDGASIPSGLRHINDYQVFMRKNGLLNGHYDIFPMLRPDLIRETLL